jgi:hypothetical protein
MLRMNLLRDLAPSASAKSKTAARKAHKVDRDDEPRLPRTGIARRVFMLLVLAVVVAGVVSMLMYPEQTKTRGMALWTQFTDPEAPARARADSLQRVEVLRMAASRRVAQSQSQAIAWLRELETVLPPDSVAPRQARRHATPVTPDYTFSLASFTPPQTFILRGNARSLETLAGLQEALVLFPGIELRQSQSQEAEDARAGLKFAFSGTVALEEDDSIPSTNHVLPASRLDAELGLLTESAAALGIRFAPPGPGVTSRAGALRIHTHRLSASCDSVGFTAISTWLEGERYRGSPLGIQRVTLVQEGNEKTVFLDIMAFSP